MIKRKVWNAAAVGVLALLSTSAYAVSENATARITVGMPLSIESVADLRFPGILASATETTTARIGLDGTVEYGASTIPLDAGATTSAGKIVLKGGANRSVDIVISNITGGDRPATAESTSVVFTPDLDGAGGTAKTVSLDDVGNLAVPYGGKMTVSSGIPDGEYVFNFDITATYK